MNLAPETALRVLREPLSRRALRNVVYLVVVAPLTVLSLGYVVVTLVVGTALAVTALGIPLISWAVPGVRWFGSLRRRLANGLLGDDIPPPAPFLPPRGFLARVSAGLRDRTGWRTIGFLLLAVPLSGAGLYLLWITWLWGLLALTYPLAAAFGADTVPALFGWSPSGGASVFALWVIGVALVLAAPWAVRVFLVVDRRLVRVLVGGGGAAERIRDLERSRAYAIEDVAATLRRIERDLHDGVQARMVALAMNLTMLNETLDSDSPDESRRLLTAALGHAKDGIVELRQMVGGIHPPALDAGLATALGTLAARSPIPVDVRGDLPARPTEAIETIAYFTVAELLTNVTRHSGADHAVVELSESDGRMVVRVTDNGHGGASLDSRGTGLRGLTERVGTVDGRLVVDSPAGGPTVITVELPLHT